MRMNLFSLMFEHDISPHKQVLFSPFSKYFLHSTVIFIPFLLILTIFFQIFCMTHSQQNCISELVQIFFRPSTKTPLLHHRKIHKTECPPKYFSDSSLRANIKPQNRHRLLNETKYPKHGRPTECRSSFFFAEYATQSMAQ